MSIFNWWGWSDWQDVGSFDYLSTGYLIQCRVHKCGKKQFDCVPVQSSNPFSGASGSYKNIDRALPQNDN